MVGLRRWRMLPSSSVATTGNLLEITDLRVEFPGLGRSVSAVRGCTLQVARGEVVGLVGESGSGKSLTALACLGLVPAPGRVTGSIRLDGQEIVGARERDIRRLRGGVAAMIFQNPVKALSPFFTIGRQITDVVANVRHIERTRAERAAAEALEAVRIGDPIVVMRKYPHQLSGGQLQRAAISMALACKPKLLLADEPTTALDVTIQAQIIVLLRELARQHSLTVLFITHDLGVVASLCDQLAVMYAGRIVEFGRIDTLLAAPMHPYTASLLRAVPTLGRGRVALTQIPGAVPNMAALPTGCTFHPRCSSAGPDCVRDEPLVRTTADGQRFACHHPNENPACQSVCLGEPSP